MATESDVAANQVVIERLNPAVQQQLNLDSVKTRALGLYKAISRVLEEFDAIGRANAIPKWKDVLSQFSMVNLELFNIFEDIKKVSKAFVVNPKLVNAQNASILPVMLSSKLLPEMELEDDLKREQLLHGMKSFSMTTQIDKLNNRIEMIRKCCESAEKIIADSRKAYGLGSRQLQGVSLLPFLDKTQLTKIHEQEVLLRNTVNFGEGLRLPADQRQMISSFPSHPLPAHLSDILTQIEDLPGLGENSNSHQRNTPLSMSSGSITNQGTGTQLIGKSVPSPSGATGTPSMDNVSTPPLPYTNSPRSNVSMMNTPSPQQQQHILQQQQQQQRRLNPLQQHHQQLLVQQQQQQLRQQSSSTLLGQVPGQHQIQQYSQPLSQQQFHNRQLQAGHTQSNIGQTQINQANQLRTHLSPFNGNTANSMLNAAAQTSQNPQMISNMHSTIPRMQQYGLTSGHSQRNYASQMLNDQMFNIGASNSSNMVALQQQQLGGQIASGNMQGNNQNLQAVGMPSLQNTTSQNPNFQQQRPPNQQ
ncbi:Mediator of RNA polymerase II transcription subunit 8 [Zostera marina]|uniref:Mediator of RNA polymerase II transcription subunit 8 n=1 Tax=Zostera marina TaxID=29655 RepID=A0A0K9NSU1_ZOSMR|nr:Mediator of RNA polymerase II transcription subunit 8 [Zostera marina]